jgi:DNA replication licensing factor MCM4
VPRHAAAAFFKCTACEHVTINDVIQGRIMEPQRCEFCNKKFTLQIVHNRCEFLDKQVIKLQEAPDMMPAGQTPHTVLLVCYDDLVETVQPGDRLEVRAQNGTGIAAQDR